MQVPLSWIKDYVTITMPVTELAHRMTLAGLEVGDIHYIGIPDPEGKSPHLVWDREKIVLGHIVEVRSHPDADKLVLAMVDSGTGVIETCVTGAPNLYPYKDRGPLLQPLVAAYAREGAEVIDAYHETNPYARMILKPRKLRGIENKTMVCSEKELGLSNEHEGILLFESEATPGTSLQDVLGDAILTLELTPNLARCFSIIGVAREIAAITGAEMHVPALDVLAEGLGIADQVNITITQPELNPRFTLALIRDVEIKPSPFWLQRRLKMVGMRPINNIVDMTNYVMMEWGEPLHAFDYDVLVKRAGGKIPTIITRLPADGEKLTTLDDVTRDLDDFTILVADTAGALSLGGIMGGLESEVTSSTKTILLEAAAWNFINIRKTLSAQRRRNMEISSEAAIRFSRGVHPSLAKSGLLRGIEMMRQVSGGTIAKGIVDAYPLPAEEVEITLPLAEVKRILGVSLSQDEIKDILTRLEFKVTHKDDEHLVVTCPDHRLDIGALNFPDQHADIRDVVGRADLIEEIARIYGYDRIPDTLMVDELPPQRNNPSLQFEEKARDILVEAGLQELVSYRFTTPDREAQLAPAGARPDLADLPYIEIANPISKDRSVMRHTLLANMLEILSANSRWVARQAVFEVGAVFLPIEGSKLPNEPRHLSIGLTGSRQLASWQDPLDMKPALMDFFDLKGIIETLIAGLSIDKVSYAATEHPTFRPGRTASLLVGEKQVGIFGEIHPAVAAVFDLSQAPVYAAEIDLDALFASPRVMRSISDISVYPAVYQDLAIIVDEDLPASSVESVLREAGGSALTGLELFDIYRGPQIGEGKKSLAYKLAFQAPDRTLRDDDVDKLRKKVLKSLSSRLGAELRS